MEKTFTYNVQGKMLQMVLYPAYYGYNRTLAVIFYEKGRNRNEEYWELTCCMDDAPGKNKAFLDVNDMGEQIAEELEKAGFGKRTGRTKQSGFVIYPEFEFDAEILKEYTNNEYEQYLKWQNELKEDEQYLIAECDRCQGSFPLIVKKSEVEKYYEYQEGAPYLIQDIFPDLTAEERGLLARGQNVCGKCFRKMFGIE